MNIYINQPREPFRLFFGLFVFYFLPRVLVHVQITHSFKDFKDTYTDTQTCLSFGAHTHTELLTKMRHSLVG